MALTAGDVTAEVGGDGPQLARRPTEVARADPEIDPAVADHPDVVGLGQHNGRRVVAELYPERRVIRRRRRSLVHGLTTRRTHGVLGDRSLIRH
jgi:hypothetical protein